jgi:hypothetical protein
MKYPTFKTQQLPGVITIIGFTFGTIFGLSAAIWWVQVNGTPFLAAIRAGGPTALVYSPLYMMAAVSKVEFMTRHIFVLVLSVTIATAGLLVGLYCMYYSPGQTYPLGETVAIMCVAFNVLGFLVGIQKVEMTSVFPILIDLGVFVTLGLSVYGLLTDRSMLCIPFLVVSTSALVPCSWYICRMAFGIRNVVRALVDSKTGEPNVLKPVPGGPTPATQTAPVTFPPMACEPPTSDFITETRHVFVIPNYKESLELLEDTLRILATHPGCQERYIVLLAMEAGEPGGADKASTLEEKFKSTFSFIGHTLHPMRPGELAGKGSNVNYAIQQLHQFEWMQFKSECVMVTIMDADTMLPAEYIAGVDWVWASNPKAVAAALICPSTPVIANASTSPWFVRSWELFYFTCICGQMGHSGALRMPLACYSCLLVIPEEVGYWDAGLQGIAEDQHTALRMHLHYRRKGGKGPVIAIAAPYWGYCENDFRSKIKQQIRHFLGFQDMWFALARSNGLSLRDRLQVFLTISSPILLAVVCPFAALGANMIFTYCEDFNIRIAAFLVSLLGLPQAPASAFILYYVIHMWAFSEGLVAKERRSPGQVLQVVVALPLVFACQYIAGLYAKFWLLASELGYSKIVYEGARQGGQSRPLPV